MNIGHMDYAGAEGEVRRMRDEFSNFVRSKQMQGVNPFPVNKPRCFETEEKVNEAEEESVRDMK